MTDATSGKTICGSGAAPQNQKKGSTLSGGSIAGIAIGLLVLLVLLALLALLLRKRKTAKKNDGLEMSSGEKQPQWEAVKPYDQAPHFEPAPPPVAPPPIVQYVYVPTTTETQVPIAGPAGQDGKAGADGRAGNIICFFLYPNCS
jgi:hypothetical protein